jgi:membrane-associated phospholipid phosphatase
MRLTFGPLFLVVALHASAQPSDVNDSIRIDKDRTFKNNFLAPSILIGTGLIAATDNEIFDKWEIKELRDSIAPNFHTTADNYLQYAPLAAVFILKGAGVKSASDWPDLTLLIIKSEIIMTGIVFPLKSIVDETRPDGGSHSFPSGHTAQAFVAATILHKEFGKARPYISVLGYLTASTVGVLRIMNDRHWASDVLVGAGIGILSTNVAYLTHRYRPHRRHAMLSRALVTPTWSRHAPGLSVSLRIP